MLLLEHQTYWMSSKTVSKSHTEHVNVFFLALMVVPLLHHFLFIFGMECSVDVAVMHAFRHVFSSPTFLFTHVCHLVWSFTASIHREGFMFSLSQKLAEIFHEMPVDLEICSVWLHQLTRDRVVQPFCVNHSAQAAVVTKLIHMKPKLKSVYNNLIMWPEMFAVTF